MGPYQSLREDPRTAFVAGFLGRPPMNLLAGGVVDGGALRLDELVVPLPDEVKARAQAGQRMTLGVRPEAMRWRIEAGGPGRERQSVLRGMVETVEPDMAYRTQTIYVRSGSLFYAATGALDDPISVGDQVEVALPPSDALYFFDAQTELRIPAHPGANG
jgi:ABC-type sugar transport system ATPase subunit